MTDEDKTLLELAAKAAGLTYEWDGNGRYLLVEVPWRNYANLEQWNPLTDDGEALRLAVQQGLEICRDHDEIRGEYVEVFYRPYKYARQKSCIEYHKDHPDQVAATRRAIVRAASSIGGKL